MTANEVVQSIEHLTQPNEMEPVEMPQLDITFETHLEQTEMIECLKRHLYDALRSLAVTKADHHNAEDIIKQWRAYNGFTSDDQGNIHFAV